MRARPGVAAVNALPSADGEATAIAVELSPGLGDGEEEDLVAAVAGDLRAIDAPRCWSAASCCSTRRSPPWPSRTPSGAR